jgi:amino acid permease
MESDEKKALEKVSHVDQERSTSSITQDNYDEALDEPRQEESLHRGLKARQISMIAVSVFLSAPSSYSQLC